VSTGANAKIGIGPEATWGTAVGSARWLKCQETIAEDRGRLREANPGGGTRSTMPADPGRLRITGGLQDIHVRPAAIGDLFRAAFGAPATVAGPPNVHTFQPAQAKFAAEAALPPYSATIEKGSKVFQYSGGQANQLELRQAKDDVLMANLDLIFKNVAAVASEVATLDNGTRFRYGHLAVTKGGVAFPYLEDLTLTVANALDTEETLNGDDVISAVDFNDQLKVTAAMTLTFRDASTYDAFAAGSTDAYVFTWTIDANNILEITIPKLNIDSWSAPVNGPGRLTIAVQATAEYDAASGYELQAVLTNDVAAYGA